jgi:hypothetical protein
VIFKNDEELQAKCEEWQKRLRLQDWIVECNIVRSRDMEIEDAAAECHPILKKKIAALRIRDSIDYPIKDMIGAHDMEQDLVHELLHLYLFPIHNDENDIVVEQIVDCLATSFISLHREKLPQAKKELKVV